jgi:hypothetical protein
MNVLDQATDGIGTLGPTFEKAVVYCVLPIASAKVILHGRTP